jgi:hypothetical protein
VTIPAKTATGSIPALLFPLPRQHKNMAQTSAAKPDSPPPTVQEISLINLSHCDQLIVETCNSTYVFLWDTLYSSRLIRCSNENLDLGSVSLLGSYSGEPSLQASGRLRVGEAMVYLPNPLSRTSDLGNPAILTSPIIELRCHRQDPVPALPRPGLLQPQSKFYQERLTDNQTPLIEQKYEGSPVLWTPVAPKIPRSAVSSSLIPLKN